ncbi:PTS family galactitol (Gat) porter component IIC domain protein [Clostridioides difficile P77]|nr:PTS family galactitol (Gat) porter component IIC domain protein [Clostridioides difficile P77]
MALNASFKMPEGATMISSICDGANPLSWVFVKVMNYKVIGGVVFGVIALGMAIYNRNRIINENKKLSIEE